MTELEPIKVPSSKQLQRFNLQWRPSFTYTRGQKRMYVIGEKTKYFGDNLDQSVPTVAQDPNTFSLQEIVRVAQNSVLLLPLNSSVALAQQYTVSQKNKVVEQETLGGNTTHSFGQGIKQLGLNITIIKAGRHWEIYQKGLEAMSYLSSDETRFYGSLFLTAFDTFEDGTQLLAGRYKVKIKSLEFSHRSDKNTTLTADLRLNVDQDLTNYNTQKFGYWGRL